MKKIIKSLMPMICIFSIHIILVLIFDIYKILPKIDILMHSLGGFVSAWTIYLLHKNFKEKFKIKIEPQWILLLIIVANVALIGVGWEFMEFLNDINSPLSIPRQISLADTMGDLALDLLGAIIFLPFVKK